VADELEHFVLGTINLPRRGLADVSVFSAACLKVHAAKEWIAYHRLVAVFPQHVIERLDTYRLLGGVALQGQVSAAPLVPRNTEARAQARFDGKRSWPRHVVAPQALHLQARLHRWLGRIRDRLRKFRRHVLSLRERL